MNISKAEARSLIKNDPVKIGQWLGFRDLTELHNEWLKLFLFSDDDKTLQAHRGAYKTTVLSLGLSLFTIIFPDETVLYFRKTDTDVQEISRQIANILQTPLLHELARALYGHDYTFNKISATEIDTSLSTNVKGASQIVGLGIGTSITGKHADVVVTDDIINMADRVSRAERERTKRAYLEMQNIKNRGGRFFNTGTPWHIDDAFSLMPKPIKYDCYSTGLISEEQLAELKEKMTAALFAANYELKHIADENALFQNPDIGADKVNIEQGNAHIDAAYGGSDSTAFTICRKIGDEYYIFGKLWQKHVDDCLDDCIGYVEQYMSGKIYVEDNGDKGYLAKELRNRGQRVHKYHESMNKFVKISSYLKPIWKHIHFVEGTDDEYINQICDYNENAEHDDAPDSCASIIRTMTFKKSNEGYKSPFDRRL